MRLLQYEKLQEVVSVISGLSIKIALCNETAFCDKPVSVLEGLLWLFLFI